MRHEWTAVTLCGIAGFLIFAAEILNPANDLWLMTGDRGQHYLGWVAFRLSPWGWPLGYNALFLYPSGTSVALTDSIPLLAIPLKLISALLPVTFQYTGLWIASCYVLLALTSFWLLRLVSVPLVASVIGAVLVTVNPVMFWRQQHEALMAQWVIVLAFIVYVRQVRGSPRWWLEWTLLAALAITIHSYLVVMVLILAFGGILLEAFRRPSWPTLIVQTAYIVLVPVGILSMFGYWNIDATSVGGFGFFGADIATWVIPGPFSAFVPNVVIPSGLGEGYAYLGLGVMLLIVLAMVLAVRTVPRWRVLPILPWIPLLLAVGVLWVFATSSILSVFGQPVYSYRHLSVYLPLDALRASGRCIWPLYYLLLFGGITIVARNLPKVAPALLALALVAQVADLSPALTLVRTFRNTTGWFMVSSPVWQGLRGSYDRISIAPVEAGEFRCGDETNDNLRMVRWMYLATVTGLPVNSAYLSRVPTESVRRECDTLLAMQNAPVIAPGEVVIVRSDALLPRFRSQPSNTCGEVDGLQVCVAAGRDTELAALLRRQ